MQGRKTKRDHSRRNLADSELCCSSRTIYYQKQCRGRGTRAGDAHPPASLMGGLRRYAKMTPNSGARLSPRSSRPTRQHPPHSSDDPPTPPHSGHTGVGRDGPVSHLRSARRMAPSRSHPRHARPRSLGSSSLARSIARRRSGRLPPSRHLPPSAAHRVYRTQRTNRPPMPNLPAPRIALNSRIGAEAGLLNQQSGRLIILHTVVART
jgi:hypothetical protein